MIIKELAKKIAKTKFVQFLAGLPIALLIVIILGTSVFTYIIGDLISEFGTAENNPNRIYEELGIERIKELVQIKKSDDNS